MSTNTKGVDVAHTSRLVVYERATGSIVHVHEVVTLRGVRKPGTATMTREALELAGDALRTRALAARQVSVLDVSGHKFEPTTERSYKVDVRNRRLRSIRVKAR